MLCLNLLSSLLLVVCYLLSFLLLHPFLDLSPLVFRSLGGLGSIRPRFGLLFGRERSSRREDLMQLSVCEAGEWYICKVLFIKFSLPETQELNVVKTIVDAKRQRVGASELVNSVTSGRKYGGLSLTTLSVHTASSLKE